jgi:Ca2+-binding RTX toxin-like protein
LAADAGTGDVLYALVADGQSIAPTVSGVEILNLGVSGDLSSTTVSLEHVTGETRVNLSGNADLALNGLDADATVGIGFGAEAAAYMGVPTGFSGNLTLALADATGVSDQLTIEVAAPLEADLHTSGVETLAFDLHKVLMSVDVSGVTGTGTFQLSGGGDATLTGLDNDAEVGLKGFAGVAELGSDTASETSSLRLTVDDASAQVWTSPELDVLAINAGGVGPSTLDLTGVSSGTDIQVLGNQNLSLFVQSDLDASGFSGDLRVEVFGGGVTVTGGVGDDRLYGSDDGSTTLSGGLGNDVIDAGDHGDRLDGGEGNDILSTGVGNDTLAGGDGRDVFSIEGYGWDTIEDFTSAAVSADNYDLLVLNRTLFDELALGFVSANNFVEGTGALDADDYLIYDINTGMLYYDSDGSGDTLAVQIASLGAATVLNADDIMVT